MSDETSLILVVDDNEMNRDMLSRRLKRLGHQTMVAEDGQKALDAIHEHHFDLVLLDIMMPNLNGYDTLEQIKSSEATQHIPVIMISAVDDLESVVRCIELGAEDYLFKPFNPVLLKARVGASLEKTKLRKSSSSTVSAQNTSGDVTAVAQSIHQGLTDLSNDLTNLTDEQRTKMKDLLDLVQKLIQ